MRKRAAEKGGVAGAPGFEPGNGGIKIRCLTTWLRPIARPDHTGAEAAGQTVRHRRSEPADWARCPPDTSEPWGTAPPRAHLVLGGPRQSRLTGDEVWLLAPGERSLDQWSTRIHASASTAMTEKRRSGEAMCPSPSSLDCNDQRTQLFYRFGRTISEKPTISTIDATADAPAGSGQAGGPAPAVAPGRSRPFWQNKANWDNSNTANALAAGRRP